LQFNLNKIKTKPMTTQSTTKSIGQSFLRLGSFLIALGLVCLALLPIPNALAVTPAPDGGYVGWNTAEGQDALFSLTTGGFNTAIGGHALYGDSTGGSNTGVGAFSLAANSEGYWNVAVGQGALRNNTVSANVAVGTQALYNNTDGLSNTATGYQALFKNDHGDQNTAFGQNSLHENITGNHNTAIGWEAGAGNRSGSGDIYIGSGTTANFEGESGAIRIGNAFRSGYNACYIQGIHDSSENDTAVYVGFDGHLGTLVSSRRFKEHIKPMDKSSEAIFALKPVTFRYKSDAKKTPRFGLIAEDVAQVDPDLVVRDKSGEATSVRYEQVNAMLLNEFLKEHRKVEELEKARADEQREIAELKQQVKAQAAAIQKVSDRLELRTLLPQVVDNR
jgi:hypothetical protein